MTEEEIRTFHANLDALMGSLECLRLGSIMYQRMGAHESVYPAAEKVLGSTIEACTTMREQIRQERGKLPYKLP